MKKSQYDKAVFLWALQCLSALHHKPFSQVLADQQIGAVYTSDALVKAFESIGFDAQLTKVPVAKLSKNLGSPFLAICTRAAENTDEYTLLLVLQANAEQLVVVEPGSATPRVMAFEEFRNAYTGHGLRVMPSVESADDADSAQLAREQRRFGFRWFLPELRRHTRLWQEILLASLVIQLIALATPLLTQAIIDKVVVHRTQSTLIVVVIGMAIFMLFSASLSWLRQYLILHTGNRVDAVLGGSVFERLFKLPPLYFQHRPTGVISARLHGVETVREFISSAAVTLVLDLPFLFIFVAVMSYYSVTLTLLVLGILAVIVATSLLIAPVFQRRLQEQFQLGARNEAFVTEYVMGLETVKSLQLEPQLNSRYSGYLASFLTAGFATKQLANTYNTFANLLDS